MGGVLVTGGSGQVGGEIARRLRLAGREVHVPGRGEMDLADAGSVRDYVRVVRPEWVLNSGAYTAVDLAEGDRETAFKVNGVAPGVLGEEARAVGAGVVHFSTDYVFSGDKDWAYREEDATGPLGVYGASKLAGEEALAASGARYVTLRTSWVYGAVGKNFLLTVLRVARQRETMRIVEDQHGAPTGAGELAGLAIGLLGRDWESGVYHAAAAGETTWLGFAAEALRLRREVAPGERLAELVGIPTSEYPTAARRPLNSRLDCGKLKRVFGVEMRGWEEVLGEVMGEVDSPPHAMKPA